jgi:transposase
MPTEKESEPKVDPFAPTEHLIKELEEYLKNAPNQRMSTLAKCILFRVRDNKDGREIASLLGKPLNYVRLNHSLFRRQGFSIFKTKVDPFNPTKHLIKKLEEHLETAPDPQIAMLVQCVLSRVRDNKTGNEIASLLGRSLIYVKLAHWRFRHQGFSLFEKKQSGSRIHAILTLEQEQEFLAPFAQDVLAGNLLEVKNLHSALEEHLNRKVALSTVYGILRRNGWCKLKPDSGHSNLTKNTGLWFPQDV